MSGEVRDLSDGIGERKRSDTPAGATASAARQASEKEFAQERKRQAAENDRLSGKYDTIITSLKDAISDSFPEELAKREEGLRSRYDELRLRASEARRAGKDMFVPALVLRQFPAKLALAHASREPKEYELARVILDQARFEIDEAEAAPILDVKQEVLRMAGVEETPTERRGTLKKEAAKGMEER